MKECPNCKKIYNDDLFYCLDDGTSLTFLSNGVDHSAPTEIAISVGQSARTEVLPNIGRSVETKLSSLRETSTPVASSKLPYIAIGALTLACISLAGAMLVLNRDRIFPAQETKTNTINETRTMPSPTASNMPLTNVNTVRAVNLTVTQPTVTFDPAGRWKGQWSTDSGTLLDIEISITNGQNNAFDGQIKWTMRKTARPDKMDKIGLSATEFVRGSFDPATGSVKMSGYNKDDPNNVLVMLDSYKLNITSDGHTLSGVARNGGKWNGHLRLTR